MIKRLLLTGVVLLHCCLVGEEAILYFQPNTTQLFTEIYETYGIRDLPPETSFEDAIYLDQSTPGTILPMQPANEVVFGHASEVLSRFHKQMGDFELYVDAAQPPPFFYTANGSKQLIVALVYAIANADPSRKFLFVEQAPFYSGHPNAVTGVFPYPNARFQAFHNVKDIRLESGEELVEFVTSPNNPDGTFRKPLTDAQIIIADFVFASSVFGSDGMGYRNANIEWIKKARASGKHVFSFNSASKQFGKTGARCGYIWYPMHDAYAKSIFPKFFGFISTSTIAGGTIGLANFLDLIQALLKLPHGGESIRQDARKILLQRHRSIEKAFVSKYPGSTVLSIPGSATFFVKMHDPRLPKMRASDILLTDLKISVNSGDTMGETTEYIRLNLCGKTDTFQELLKRF